MKFPGSLLNLMVILVTLIISGNPVRAQNKNYKSMVDNIHWLGQAAVKIATAEKVIYIDPYRIRNKDQADIVLITHGHSDHLSPDDIEKIITANSIIVAPDNCTGKLKDFNVREIKSISPGQTIALDDINITAVPAYNVVKTNFHPKSNNWVGYVVNIEGTRIYHAGDTERIPEMKDIECDIAMLPLGQTYTMNSVKDAADAAVDVKAGIAIPIHYGLYEGKEDDAKKFKELLAGKVEVIIKHVE
ncbi:MAG: MBL fold metallo-hydrolase [Bacteroidales bacterium]|nr:MAG: MBL fold metallo-hydrolase [Bacteroidales bacterium]